MRRSIEVPLDPAYRGRSGIRTHETRERLTVFKTVAFVRSAILPPSILAGRADPGVAAAGLVEQVAA